MVVGGQQRWFGEEGGAGKGGEGRGEDLWGQSKTFITSHYDSLTKTKKG